MLGFLLELIFEFFVEFIFQVIIELGFESVAENFRKRRSLPRILAFIFLSITGGTFGLFWSNMFPERILHSQTIPGASLLLAPLCTGLIMKLFGDWRRTRGHEPTTLATFWGGALFAFSMAFVRWLRVGRVA